MTYVITKKCIGCVDAACVDACPVDCIVGPAAVDELGIQMFIDPDECIHCGACVQECPVDAIYADNEVPDEHRDDVARNASFFKLRVGRGGGM